MHSFVVSGLYVRLLNKNIKIAKNTIEKYEFVAERIGMENRRTEKYRHNLELVKRKVMNSR